MSFFRKNKGYFITIILTIIGFCVLFSLSSVYPFGSNIIDIIDFDGGYIPTYYKLWDVLHLKNSAMFDWNLGSGLNSFGSLISNGFISPLCWIIGLFKRSDIPYAMSYIYLLKMIFASFITYFSIGKILPETKDKNKILFTLLYVFSGYTFLNSSNILYLDAFGLFPLFVYSLKELLEKGKWKLYVIVLTLILMISYYMAYLDLFFLVGCSAIYLIVMKTDHKKEKAVKVLIFTLVSLLLSCVLFLPGFMLTKTSYRMSNNTSDFGIFAYFLDKSIHLFTLAIPFVLTFKQLLVKKDKRINLFIILLCLYTMIGVFIEPINALWHTGSHSSFPFRYSNIPTFILILSSLHYLNKNYVKKENTHIIRIVIPIALMILMFVIFKEIRLDVIKDDVAYSLDDYKNYFGLLILFIVNIFTFVFILRNSSKRAYFLTFVLVLFQIVVYGNLYLIFKSTTNTSLYSDKIAENFDLVSDGYNYYSDLSNININFPYIMKVPSYANRLHFIRKEMIDQSDNLGFKRVDTVITSEGGNEFTNLLLQNKYYLVSNELDTDLYKLIDSKDGIYYYESLYNLNYIIPYNGKDYDEESKDCFDNSNNIYKTLFDKENDIYENVDIKDNSIKVKKDNIYYILLSYENLDIDNVGFSVTSDKKINYSISVDTSNKLAIIKIKALSNTSVNFSTTFDVIDSKAYLFNKAEFVDFVESNNEDVSVEVKDNKKIYTYDCSEDTSVLLPINYDDNYVIKVNGKKVDYKLNLYNMLSIDVKKGKNVIEVSYNQKYFKLGLKISIITLIILIVFYLLDKKVHFLNHKFIVWPLFILTFVIFVLFMLKVYLLSWI